MSVLWFCYNFFKEGPCASGGSPEPEFAWTSVPRFLFYELFFWTPCTVPCWGERSWEAYAWSWVEDSWPFPLRASLKHQHLERMGGSCGAVAGSACFLHDLLTSEAVPMNVI